MSERLPLYIELKNMIQQRLENGDLTPGEKLPSERALASIHGLSRMTVRQALSELVKAGALYREQGRGTFVSARKMQQRNIASFSETVRQKGFTPSTRVLEFSRVRPPNDIAKKLMVSNKDVYRALRIRLADDIPVALEEVFIPFHICPGLRNKDLTSSLYKLISNTFGHKIGSADSSVTALHPSAKQQAHLCITRNTPVLKIDSLYYSAGGSTLYYEHALYRADMYEYTIRISTQPGV